MNAMRTVKKSLLLASGAAAVLLGIGGMALHWSIAIDGNYTGRILDSLSGDARLVMDHGEALIRRPGGDLVPYGNYWKVGESWRLLETGSTNEWWEIDRRLGGFDLVRATNSQIRYRFTKRWLN